MDLSSFILAYFSSKNVSLITAFLCWSLDDIRNLQFRTRSTGLRLRVYISKGSVIPEMPAYRIFREGVVLDLSCPDAHLILNKASVSRAFNLRHSWLLLPNILSNDTDIVDFLQDTVILPDADVVVAFPEKMFDVYRVKIEQPIAMLDIGGGYTNSENLNRLWATIPTAVTRRKNLGHVYLKSATIVSQPQYFKGWSDLNDRQIDTFPKLSYPLMMLLAEDLNFRYNMKQIELYGEQQNGSFNGLAGLLQREEVEMGVASMFLRRDRWDVLHYCSETVELVGAFIFRQPSQSAVSNVFLLPFSGGVWAAVGVAFAGGGVLLAVLGYVARRRQLPDDTAERLTLSETFTFAIGAACQQGSDISPEIVSARILMLFMLLSSVFAFTSYSAKIVSILQAPSDAIQTIDDLTYSPMILGVQDTTYKQVYFAESTDPATQRLYKRKLQPQGEHAYLSVWDGIARVRTGLFAFQVELNSGYDVISRTYTEGEKCGLKEIQAFKLPMVSVPIRKHSGYRDLFAVRLRWQREAGLIERARRIWMARRVRCEAGGSGFVSVGLGDVLPALHALLTGAGAALLLLLAEILTSFIQRRHHF